MGKTTNSYRRERRPKCWRGSQPIRTVVVASAYAAGYHMLLHDLQREVVWNDVGTWIVDPTTDLPSRADAYARETSVCPAPVC